MSITPDEIKWYYPAEVNESPENGGRMTCNEIVDRERNNVWPNISNNERLAGSVRVI